MQIATDPLSLLFIACFLFGLLFLVASALLGSLGHGGTHHVHVGGHAHVPPGAVHASGTQVARVVPVGQGHAPAHPQSTPQGIHNAQGNDFSFLSYVNPTSIVLFLLGFGFFGYVFHNTAALVLPLALALAGVSGLIVAGLLLALINRVFGDSEGATVQDVSDRTGLLGKVSVTIRENSLGEVIYVSPGGMRKSIPARSVDGRRLERDQEVVVVNYQRGIAEVDTWDHFIQQTDVTEAPKADELAELRALLEEPTTMDTELVMRKDLQKE